MTSNSGVLHISKSARDIAVRRTAGDLDGQQPPLLLRHFAGVLGLTPWRAEWPRASFSFLKLHSVILPTIRESESSRNRGSKGHSHEVVTEPSETEPNESSEPLHVRELLRESEERVIREDSRDEQGVELVERHRTFTTEVESVHDPEKGNGRIVRRKSNRSQSEGRPDRPSTRSYTAVETTLHHESATSVESENEETDSDPASHHRRRVTPEGVDVTMPSEARTPQRSPEDDSSGDRADRVGASREKTAVLQQALPEQRSRSGRTAFGESGPSPPTMEPLRTPVGGAVSTGGPAGSVGSPSKSTDRSSIDSPVTDVSGLRPEPAGSEKNGDMSSRSSPQSKERASTPLEDELDVERLADRLERVFERKSRIERERRGR